MDAIRKWPLPHFKTKARAFLGIMGYYRQHIHNYAAIAKPWTDVIGKTVDPKKEKSPLRVTESMIAAFQKLKEVWYPRQSWDSHTSTGLRRASSFLTQTSVKHKLREYSAKCNRDRRLSSLTGQRNLTRVSRTTHLPRGNFMLVSPGWTSTNITINRILFQLDLFYPHNFICVTQLLFCSLSYLLLLLLLLWLPAQAGMTSKGPVGWQGT